MSSQLTRGKIIPLSHHCPSPVIEAVSLTSEYNKLIIAIKTMPLLLNIFTVKNRII